MFNGSTTASPILFGIYDTTNVQEAARISAARNFLIGTTTDDGTKLQVAGFITGQKGIFNSQASGNDVLYLTTAGANTNFAFKITGAATDYLTIRRFNNSVGALDIMSFTFGGNALIGTTTDTGEKLQVNGTALISNTLTTSGNASTSAAIICNNPSGGSGTAQYYQEFKAGGTLIARLFRGNSFVGTVGDGLNIDNFGGFQIRANQLGGSGETINLLGGNVLIGTNSNGGSKLRIVGLPTSAVGLSSGDVYSNAGILTIVP